jgi:hypothetical protein
VGGAPPVRAKTAGVRVEAVVGDGPYHRTDLLGDEDLARGRRLAGQDLLQRRQEGLVADSGAPFLEGPLHQRAQAAVVGRLVGPDAEREGELGHVVSDPMA